MLRRAFSLFTCDSSRIIPTAQRPFRLPIIHLTKRYESSTPLTDSEYLENFNQWVETVNKTPSLIEKHKIVSEATWCHAILKRIYDPHLRHYVTSKRAIDHINKQTEPNESSESPYTLVELIDTLSSRKLTGNGALNAISQFYNLNCQTNAQQQMFWRIIDRNLKMGVSTTTITRVLERDPSQDNLDIFNPQTLRVALARPLINIYEPNLWEQTSSKSPEWYGSRKLDGVRCITFVQKTSTGHKIHFFSRTGKPFNSLEKVEAAIRRRLEPEHPSFVLDGEVCVYRTDDPNLEDFLAAVGQIRTRNQSMENPVYQLFDIIDITEFKIGDGTIPFHKRQEQLKKFAGKPQKNLAIIEQIKLETFDDFQDLYAHSVNSGWEGLILRKDVPYQGRRSRNMLKVKEWEDDEYVIKNIETGQMRMPDTGEDRMVMTNVIIEHKGHPVSVGSGLSIQQRIQYAKDPDLIIGKVATVRYFQELEGKNDSKSLRFPTIKAIYDKREI
ncbi:hypothetical protein CLU79DRAFT_717642 [Phycomyces nitens]|nr:hypothetical protein CLU79DRAFT_717642 [Phycomyces nitens]